MAGYSKLWSTIITSSVWSEDDKTRLMWITMLAIADETGKVDGSIPGLADISRMSIPEAEMALAKLEAPDKYSRTPDLDGRRIIKVDGGWRIVNYIPYRERRDANERRAYKRQWDREHRPSGHDRAKKNNKQSDKSPTKPDKVRLSPTQAEAEAEAEAEKGASAPSASTQASSPKKPSEYPEDFEQFYAAYPKHKSKADALKAWEQTKAKRPPLDDLIAKVRALAATHDWTRDGGQYVPHPGRWLRAGGWDDDPGAPPGQDGPAGYDFNTMFANWQRRHEDDPDGVCRDTE